MSKTEPTTVQLTICPYGDLKLSIQSSTVNATYLVSSHQLGCASAVFRASLRPSSGFTEAINLHHSVSDDLIYEMRIGEELGFYPTAMAVVLYVIHAQLQHVPGSIGFKNLLDIAIIYCSSPVTEDVPTRRDRSIHGVPPSVTGLVHSRSIPLHPTSVNGLVHSPSVHSVNTVHTYAHACMRT